MAIATFNPWLTRSYQVTIVKSWTVSLPDARRCWHLTRSWREDCGGHRCNHRSSAVIVRSMNSSEADIIVVESLGPEDEAHVEEAMRLLPRIGRSLYSGLERHSLSHGLPLTQVKALLHVAQFRDYQSCSVGDIAHGVGISMPAASELVDRLVEAGLVERLHDPADRRRVLLHLTQRARAFTEEMTALRRCQLSDALAQMTPAERPVLIRSLEALLAALQRTSGGTPPCPSSSLDADLGRTERDSRTPGGAAPAETMNRTTRGTR